MRNAGIPIQGIPAEHIGAQPAQNQQSDVLAQANPNFGNGFQNMMASDPSQFHASGGVPLPDAKPGENGLIGLLSSSIRKLFKDSGVADALSQSLPNVLGTGQSSNAAASNDAPATHVRRHPGKSGLQGDATADETPLESSAAPKSEVRRQQSAAERALSGFASALGGGGANSPKNAGLPRIPGIPLLPGGIPRNAQGQIDVVNLIGSITRRISNGTTLGIEFFC